MEIVNITETKNNIVKKSQQLLTSRYTLRPLEIKTITTLISMIKMGDDKFEEYIFKVSDFQDSREAKNHNIYNLIEELAEGLLRKPVTIRSDNGDWLKANWVASARYKKGEGHVVFKISDDLRPYLLALKEKFVQYKIENILPLKSSYTIRLYELLKDWFVTQTRYDNSKSISKIIEVSWLRKTFEIPESYNYADIKRNILIKSKLQLSEHTDIKFTYEEIKTARRVTHLKITVTDNPKNIVKKAIPNKKQTLAALRQEAFNCYKNCNGNCGPLRYGKLPLQAEPCNYCPAMEK